VSVNAAEPCPRIVWTVFAEAPAAISPAARGVSKDAEPDHREPRAFERRSPNLGTEVGVAQRRAAG